MLRGSQRNPSPLSSRSVLRPKPTEGKGVPEVPVGDHRVPKVPPWKTAHPLCPWGLIYSHVHEARLEEAPKRPEHQQWPHVVALLLSEGGTWPHPGSRPPSGPVAGPQPLQVWTGQVRVRGPVQAPGEGPAPTLTAALRVARAGTHGRARGSGLRALEQKPGISGCRQFASNLLARHKRYQH